MNLEVPGIFPANVFENPGLINLNPDHFEFGLGYEQLPRDVAQSIAKEAQFQIWQTVIGTMWKQTEGSNIFSSSLPRVAPRRTTGYLERYLTPTSQRKSFHWGLSDMLSLPMPDNAEAAAGRGLISYKGNGYTLGVTWSDDFKRRDQINGFTGRTNELEIEKHLIENQYQFADLFGDLYSGSYCLPRRTLMIMPISEVILENKILNLRGLDMKSHPLATGENRPVVIAHLNYSHLTFRDITSHIDALKKYWMLHGNKNSRKRSNEVKDLFIEENRAFRQMAIRESSLAYIRQMASDALPHKVFHPRLARFGDLSSLDYKKIITEVFPDYLAGFVNLGYINSRIQSWQHVALSNRHDQNMTPVGDTDYEGSTFDCTKVQENFTDSYNNHLDQLVDVLARFQLGLSVEERLLIAARVEDSLNNNSISLPKDIMKLRNKAKSKIVDGLGPDMLLSIDEVAKRQQVHELRSQLFRLKKYMSKVTSQK